MFRSFSTAVIAALLTGFGPTPQSPDFDTPSSDQPRAFATGSDGAEPGATGSLEQMPVPPKDKQALFVLENLLQTTVSATVLDGKNDLNVVERPDAYPASAIVLANMDFEACTGFLYAPNMVGVAGHCVYSWHFKRWANAASSKVLIGLHGSSGPKLTCNIVALFAPEGWTVHHREEHDYGAIRIDCAAGTKAGYLGLELPNAPPFGATIMGYMNDLKHALTMPVPQRLGKLLFYKHDTEKGMSGSPLVTSSPSCAACVVGIHGTGTHGSGVHSTHNHGVAMSAAVRKALRNFRDTP